MSRAFALPVALTTVSLLVLSLAACAPEPAPVPSEPSPTPTATETTATPTLPGSRIPATCEQVFADVAGFTGGPATRIGREYLSLVAAVDQSGFDFCRVSGALGGTPVEITAVLGVDIESATVQAALDWALSYGVQTDIGGELSWTQCRAADSPSYCATEVFVSGYLAQFTTIIEGSISSDFDASLRALTTDLGNRMATWPEPVPAWQIPEGALEWAYDCETDVALTDGAVRAAMPFESAPATTFGSGDGYPLLYDAQQRQNQTLCAWESTGGDYSLAYVQILPGSAWLLEQGSTLPGDPITYPGALAASAIDDSANSTMTVWVAIDGSIISVDLYSSYLADDRSGDLAATLRIVDAIVAEFGTP